MPIPKFDWYSFGDELRGAAANLLQTQMEAKRLRELAKQQEKQFSLSKMQAEAVVKSQAIQDAINAHKAKYPERYNLPNKQQVEYLTPKQVNVNQKFSGVGGKKGATGTSISPYVSALNAAEGRITSAEDDIKRSIETDRKNPAWQKVADAIAALKEAATPGEVDELFTTLKDQLPKAPPNSIFPYLGQNYLVRVKEALKVKMWAQEQMQMNEGSAETGGGTDPLDEILNQYP